MNLNEKLAYLKKIVGKARLKTEKFKTGKIRAESANPSQYRFFDTESGKWKYARKADLPYVREIAQRRYEEKIVKEGLKQIKVIESFLNKYKPDIVKELYIRMSEQRRKLIKPYEISDEEYIQLLQQIVR